MKLLLPFCLLLTITSFANADDTILIPGKPIELTGTHGKFDFIKIDAPHRVLLACHTGNGTLDVINLDTGKFTSVLTGAAQGVAIDEPGHRYFVSSSKPAQLVTISVPKLAITGIVPLPAAADVCTYSPVLDRVVVDNDEKPQQWFIDPKAQKIATTLDYTGSGMEDLAFLADGVTLVQNLKDSNQLAKVDARQGKVLTLLPTAPAEKPHGLAVDAGDNVLIAGGNGKLVDIAATSGKVTASCDIAPKVDEIAYDPGLGRVYCASGTGAISIAYITGTNMVALGTVASAPGAHSIAVDPKTHTVWIAYLKGTTPVVQPFSAQ